MGRFLDRAGGEDLPQPLGPLPHPADALLQPSGSRSPCTSRTRALLVLVAAAVAGLGEGPQLTGLFTVRNREAPEHLRAQVFTTGASLKITGFALGTAAAGPLATWSLSGCLVAAAGIRALAALAYLTTGRTGKLRRSLRTPSPARAA